jgi:hypothetical protein
MIKVEITRPTYGHYAYIYTPMRIVDHVYFCWEWKVGFPISRDRFAIAQIRLRLHLYMLVFYGMVKKLVDIGRTAGQAQLGVFLVICD